MGEDALDLNVPMGEDERNVPRGVRIGDFRPDMEGDFRPDPEGDLRPDPDFEEDMPCRRS